MPQRIDHCSFFRTGLFEKYQKSSPWVSFLSLDPPVISVKGLQGFIQVVYVCDDVECRSGTGDVSFTILQQNMKIHWSLSGPHVQPYQKTDINAKHEHVYNVQNIPPLKILTPWGVRRLMIYFSSDGRNRLDAHRSTVFPTRYDAPYDAIIPTITAVM